MKTINIKEVLNNIDKDTDNQFDLLNTYESKSLSESKKTQLAKMLTESCKPMDVYNLLNGRSKKATTKKTLKESVEQVREGRKPGKTVPRKIWSAACSNYIGEIKRYFEGGAQPNRRWEAFGSEHSLIMGALRNGNLEAVKVLKSFGETIMDSEREEYNYLLNHLREYPKGIKHGSVEDIDTLTEDYDDEFDWSVYDDYGYDDYEDDWEEANLYGGDLIDCPICGRTLSYDEDGGYCAHCGQDAYWLAQQRREQDEKKDESIALPFSGGVNINVSGNSASNNMSGNKADMSGNTLDAKVAEVNPNVQAQVNPVVKADGASVAVGGANGSLGVPKIPTPSVPKLGEDYEDTPTEDLGIKKLAQDLNDFLSDYDYYGYMDALNVGDTAEDAINDLMVDLADGEKSREGIIAYLKEIKENESDPKTIAKVDRLIQRVRRVSKVLTEDTDTAPLSDIPTVTKNMFTFSDVDGNLWGELNNQNVVNWFNGVYFPHFNIDATIDGDWRSNFRVCISYEEWSGGDIEDGLYDAMINFILEDEDTRYADLVKYPPNLKVLVEDNAIIITPKLVNTLNSLLSNLFTEKGLEEFNRTTDEPMTESVSAEEWTTFKYKSGANPYIAKTEKEVQRLLKKYEGRVEKINPKLYIVDDRDPQDDFSPRGLEESLRKKTTKTVNVADKFVNTDTFKEAVTDLLGPDETYGGNIIEIKDFNLVFKIKAFDDGVDANIGCSFKALIDGDFDMDNNEPQWVGFDLSDKDNMMFQAWYNEDGYSECDFATVYTKDIGSEIINAFIEDEGENILFITETVEGALEDYVPSPTNESYKPSRRQNMREGKSSDLYVATPTRGDDIKTFTSKERAYAFLEEHEGYQMFVVDSSEFKSLVKTAKEANRPNPNKFAFNRLHQQKKTRVFENLAEGMDKGSMTQSNEWTSNGLTAPTNEEYGSHQGEDYCEVISSDLDNGYWEGDVDGISWSLTVNGYTQAEFECDELVEYLPIDISYPVADGHLAYVGLDLIISRDSFIGSHSDTDWFDRHGELRGDLAMLGADDEDIDKFFSGETNEIEMWVDYDIDFDVEAYEEQREDDEDDMDESVSSERGSNDNKSGSITGYRNDDLYGSKVRKLQDIIEYEIDELGNADILLTLQDSWELAPGESELIDGWVDSLENGDDIDIDQIVTTCMNIIHREYPKAQYGLWLGSKEAIERNYEGTDENITSHTVTNTKPISDLGFDDQGCLYTFDNLPSSDDLTESVNDNISLSLIATDDVMGQVSASYDVIGLTNEDIEKINEIGYSTTFHNSTTKLNLTKTEGFEVFAVSFDEFDYTEVYLDIDESQDLIYCDHFEGKEVTDVEKVLSVFKKWLNRNVK